MGTSREVRFRNPNVKKDKRTNKARRNFLASYKSERAVSFQGLESYGDGKVTDYLYGKMETHRLSLLLDDFCLMSEQRSLLSTAYVFLIYSVIRPTVKN